MNAIEKRDDALKGEVKCGRVMAKMGHRNIICARLAGHDGWCASERDIFIGIGEDTATSGPENGMNPGMIIVDDPDPLSREIAERMCRQMARTIDATIMDQFNRGPVDGSIRDESSNPKEYHEK